MRKKNLPLIIMFSVLTWNVENLFRPSQTSTPEEQQHYQDKLALLAEVISLHNPSVIALQEVGGLEPLLDLQIACGYHHRDISKSQTSAIYALPFCRTSQLSSGKTSSISLLVRRRPYLTLLPPVPSPLHA